MLAITTRLKGLSGATARTLTKMIDSILGFFTQKILLAVCGALAGIALVFFLLYRSATHDLRDLQTSFSVAQAKADAEAARLRAESERIARESSEGWSAAVDYWRANPRLVRVRDSGNCALLRPVSTPPGQLDARPAQQGLDTDFHAALEVSIAECEKRLNDAVLDAAQLIHIQNWIRDQHAASQKAE